RAEAPRTASQQHHRLTPGVGGGGYLSNPEFRVKPFFTKRFEFLNPLSPKAFPEELAASKETTKPSQAII
ncbi:hypothetical protein ACFO0T_12855, partial [Caulobacter henricii]